MASVTASPHRFSESERTEIANVLSRLLWAIAMLPTLSIAMSLSLEVRARLTYGKWLGDGTPELADFTLHLQLAVASAVISLAAVSFVLLVGLACTAMGHLRVVVGPTLITLASFTVLFFVAQGDVGGLSSLFNR